jgi:hypothetical protein
MVEIMVDMPALLLLLPAASFAAASRVAGCFAGSRKAGKKDLFFVSNSLCPTLCS